MENDKNIVIKPKSFDTFFKKLASNPVSAQVIAQHLSEDPKKKKKKKKTNKHKSKENDMIISFRPLGNCKLKDSKDSKNIPLEHEDHFVKVCPVKFFPFQIETVRWMHWIERSRKNEINVGGILADEMGLGKTIMSIGIVAYDYLLKNIQCTESTSLKESTSLEESTFYDARPDKPTLIITKMTLISQWYNEAVSKFKIPEKHICVYRETNRQRDLEKRLKGTDDFPSIVITNYETVQKDHELNEEILFKTQWKRVHMDESHEVRNPKTRTFRALLLLQAESKWCITGTPIVNYPDDFRNQSQLCTPNFLLNYGSSLQESRWRSLYLLRRTKKMVGIEIPEMEKQDVWLELTVQERMRYSEREKWANEIYADLLQTQTLNQRYQQILLVLVRLLQECNNYLLQEKYATSKILANTKSKYGVSDVDTKKDEMMVDMLTSQDEISKMLCFDEEEDQSFVDWDDMVDLTESEKRKVKKRKAIESDREAKKSKLIHQAEESNSGTEMTFEYSTKLTETLRIVRSIFEKSEDDKIVIFSQFTTMLDLIEAMFIIEGIPTLRFDGRVQKSEHREIIIDQFYEVPKYRVLLASLKAGGVGLNLVVANHLIMINPWWNSAVEHQAFYRVHRIGQKKKVYVYRLLIRSSIEEEVLKIQEKKNNHEDAFYDVILQKVLSIKDIHCVFNTMRVRQAKNNSIS
jgi:SNF2 family DNA or RNA helicase